MLFLSSRLGAQVTSVVAQGVLLACETATSHDVDHKHIAYDGHHGGGCGGSKPERTHFRCAAGSECDIGYAGKLAVRIAGDAN